ncbi:MAG: NUDIX domain-containing protein [Candidatus Eisenbacteria bacterium]|nr:NUDIX domain-containing protein [Candidatus Eisenbacteria bacterium]
MSSRPIRLSAKVLLRDNNGRCLLLKRSLSSRGSPGRWDLPGGKVDSGESFEQGLLREVAEETGLRVSLQRVLGASEYESPTTRVAYLILEGIVESGEVRLSSEHDEYIWVDPHDLADMDLVDQFRVFAKNYIQAEES